MADDEVVAHSEGAGLDQDGGDRAPTALEVGVDDGADRVAVGVGLEVLDLGRQDDRGQQVVEPRTGSGRGVDALVLAAVVDGDDALLGELGVDPVDVGVVLVDLVDRHDDRHLGRLGVLDGLDRLRHHAVVGGDDQDDHVGDLGTPGAHGGERLVAGGVDEDDRLSVRGRDLVGADPLGDAARLARRDPGLPNCVQDRGLAVVDVAEDGDDRRPRDQLAGVLQAEGAEELLPAGYGDLAVAGAPVLLDCHRLAGGDRLHGHAELVGDDRGGVEIDDLVDGRHQPVLHQLLDDLDGAHAELVGEVLDRDVGRQLDLFVTGRRDLGGDGRAAQGVPSRLDRRRRQRGRRISGEPPLLEEVHELLLADVQFAC